MTDTFGGVPLRPSAIPPKPESVTVAWGRGEFDGEYVGTATLATGNPVAFKLTDTVAPSGTHYRILDASTKELPRQANGLASKLDIAINGCRLILEWNGSSRHTEGDTEYTDQSLTAVQVADLRGEG